MFSCCCEKLWLNPQYPSGEVTPHRILAAQNISGLSCSDRFRYPVLQMSTEIRAVVRTTLGCLGPGQHPRTYLPQCTNQGLGLFKVLVNQIVYTLGNATHMWFDTQAPKNSKETWRHTKLGTRNLAMVYVFPRLSTCSRTDGRHVYNGTTRWYLPNDGLGPISLHSLKSSHANPWGCSLG